MYDDHGWMWGMHWGWWLFWLLVIIAIAWLFARFRPTQKRTGIAAAETPEEILHRRYAAGEITTAEYEERKARLRDRSV